MRLLNRSQVVDLLDAPELIDHMSDAFEQYDPGAERAIPAQRAPFSLPGSGNGSGMVIFPGLVPSIPAYSVKVHAKFPGQDPSIRGVLLLHELESGALLAAMDSTHLTAVRTGIAAALATDLLARDDARSVAVVGAGVQGEFVIRYLSLLRSLGDVSIYDVETETARRFRTGIGDWGLDVTGGVTVADSVSDAVSGRDIVLCATWAREPFLSASLIDPGTHVTTLGSDQPGKLELTADLLESARFVCDDRSLTLEMGAIGNAALGADATDAELGEVLRGEQVGRSSAHETTIFASVGLAFQDLVAGWRVYEAAREREVGNTFDPLE